jgi:Ca2+-binding EF-hand superfamily protein
VISRLLLAATLLTLGSAALAQLPANTDALFERADTDHDGTVSRDEFIVARAAQFPRFDRNGDGYIDDQDLPRLMVGMSQIAARMAELRQQFDANHDGRVSQQEFAEGPTPVFDRADINGDGVLNAQELAVAKDMAKSRAAAMRQKPAA